MKKRNKILPLLIKILIGVASFGVIYLRLKSEFTPEKLGLLYASAFSYRGLFYFILALMLIPLNWGIEAYKWQLITAPIEKVSYRTATKSVYSGVCLGNLAPGRATEFIAKIYFFHIRNRPQVTVLHFVGGMFQLSVTIIVGFIALIFQLKNFGAQYAWIMYTTTAVGFLLLCALAFCIYRIDPLLDYIARKINKETEHAPFTYSFTPSALARLFGFSFLRYAVFYLQFILLLSLFYHPMNGIIYAGVALYFLITTTLPMISLLEAAIRAAVALVVFKGSGVSDTALAMSSVLVWLANIIIPSIFGYVILIRQNFNFKLFRARK